VKNVALIVAIVLGIVAAIGVRSYLKREKRKVEETLKPVRIAVAARSVRKGEVLTAEMVKLREMPAQALTSDSITEAVVRSYFGRPVWRNVDRGTALLASYFVQRAQEPASEVLSEGERAITLPVDITSGVAGLLRPGDRVDIIATMTLTPRGERATTDAIKTWRVLSDVTLLAVDNRLSPEYGGQIGQKSAYATVTVAVTPEEAQVLIYLRGRAALTLEMRPRFETGETEAPPVVDISNVVQLANQANEERQKRLKEKKEKLAVPEPEGPLPVIP
jgi:pilus assembly protein CpaB